MDPGEPPSADQPFDDPDTMPAEYVGTAWDPTVANGQPVYPPPTTNGYVPPADKHLGTVREASRQWMFRALTGTDAPPAKQHSLTDTKALADVPVRIATFEC